MLHTFDGPCSTKNEKYIKNVIAITFFHVYLCFHVESMKHGYSLDEKSIFASNECLRSKFE